MKAEPNPFERRLSRQPLRSVPRDWRADILAAARTAQAPEREVLPEPPSWFAVVRQQFSGLLWPHPKAWAGLAAVWLFILVLNLSMRDEASPRAVAQAAPPSPEVIVELRQQQKLFAELVGPQEKREADRPKIYKDRPRTEWLEEVAV